MNVSDTKRRMDSADATPIDSSVETATGTGSESPRNGEVMRAIVHTRYGGPDALELRDVDRPSPGPGEVLVRVRAASVNAADWHVMRGKPFLVRFMGFGLRSPGDAGFGADVAGEVEAVGRDVTAFRPGDRVFGDLSASGRGSFAEYVAIAEDALVPIPEGVSFEDAAAAPMAAVTALQALREDGQLREGDRVLVNGASGGVGTFAVQIANAHGAHVTGVCRTEKVDTVREIGADEVIDYTKVDYPNTDERYDLVLDAGAYRSVFASRRALAPGGRYVLVGGGFSQMLQAMTLGPFLSRVGDTTVEAMEAEPNQADLQTVADLLASGDVDPVVDRAFPLEDVPEAVAYLESGRATGKIVVRVE